MTTIVIGGGLTGLSAGYFLKDDVIILEKSNSPGGLCASYHIEDGAHEYDIEKYYHHIFPGDKDLIRLCDDLGLAIEWKPTSVGYFKDGKIHSLTTPVDILLYSKLSFADKARLSWFTLMCKNWHIDQWAETPVKDFIIQKAGLSLYNNFFLPLLQGKFGNDHDDISAAWLISRVQLRSNRGLRGEKLGYIKGGFQQLITALADNIEKKGGRIIKNTMAEDLVIQNNGIVEIKTNGGSMKATTVICTSAEQMGMNSCQYQGVFCILYSLKRKLSDIYWMNIGDDLSFKALVEHTNFAPFERYDEYLLYAVSYHRIIPDIDVIAASFDKDLGKLGIRQEDILWRKISFDPYAGPLYTTKYRHLPYNTGINGLFFAGMFSRPNYPERSLNGSVISGKEVAGLVNHG
jgi:protoporphyrinogen oxidase